MKRRCWRLRLAFRWCNGELFETLSAETGIDVEEMVREMARNWGRVVRSEAWGGLIRRDAAARMYDAQSLDEGRNNELSELSNEPGYETEWAYY